jgi:hypothetical protein
MLGMDTLGKGILETLSFGTPGLDTLGNGILGAWSLGIPGLDMLGNGILGAWSLGMPGLDMLGNGILGAVIFACLTGFSTLVCSIDFTSGASSALRGKAASILGLSFAFW